MEISLNYLISKLPDLGILELVTLNWKKEMISPDLVREIRKLRPADYEIGGRILDGSER